MIHDSYFTPKKSAFSPAYQGKPETLLQLIYDFIEKVKESLQKKNPRN